MTHNVFGGTVNLAQSINPLLSMDTSCHVKQMSTDNERSKSRMPSA